MGHTHGQVNNHLASNQNHSVYKIRSRHLAHNLVNNKTLFLHLLKVSTCHIFAPSSIFILYVEVASVEKHPYKLNHLH